MNQKKKKKQKEKYERNEKKGHTQQRLESIKLKQGKSKWR